MKNLLILLLLGVSYMASAQVPQKFSYQGVARDNEGQVLDDQSIGVLVTIHHSSPTGITVMEESHAVTTNAFGLFNLTIGGGTPVFADMTAISWSGGVYYLEIAIDVTGGTNYQSMGTSQLLSVPYALYAENSATPGPQGPQGPQGVQGPVGPVGPTGAANASGSLNYVAKFTPDGSTLGNSIIIENADRISVGGFPNFTKLEVADDDADNDVLDLVGLFRSNSTAGGGDGIGGAISFWNEVSNNAVTKAARISGILEDATLPTTGGALNFETQRSTGLQSAMYVNQQGNIGINTTTPQFLVDVQGSTTSISNVISGEANYIGQVDVRAVNGYSVPSDGFGVGVNGTGGWRGVVGIGMGGTYSGFAYGLYGASSGTAGTRYGVYGNATNTGGSLAYGVFGSASGATSNYAGYFSGDVYSTGSYLPSDKMLKENIHDVSDALALLGKLKVHAYTYRTESYPTMHLQEGLRYGFVADEMKAVFPQFVKTTVQPLSEPENEKGERVEVETLEFEAVNYTELIPILTQAIQDQQLLIEQLQQQNELQQQQIDALKAAE